MNCRNAKRLLQTILLIVMLGSCISKRKVIYFPNASFNTVAPVSTPNPAPAYRLQSADVLSVRIKTLDKETADYFNALPQSTFQQWNPTGLYVNGYSVDSEGNISLPEAGKIKVAGLSLDEAQKAIQEKLSAYVGNATVLLKLVSFKVTVLGEVNTPGYYYFFNDRATLLDALAMAGDLTDFGNRTKVVLVRQAEQGTQTILINLNDPKLLESKYYFLMPNDALYIQPLTAKYSRRNLTLLGVVFGAISTTILLLNYIRN
ncbi:MAG: polysaccharide export protein [Cytophagales bacterium]|nr:polysaccharide export protein [Cytophagales bacterium]